MDFSQQLARMESISKVEPRGARWLFEVAGRQGWCCEFSQGVCVTLKVECVSFDDAWLERASLWLASVRDALDDALFVDDAGLWFVRRYEAELASTEWGGLIDRQLAIVDWLSSRCARPDAIAKGGRPGAWA
jgi:hypothetical protein